MAMAMRASVTVSMAADTRGMLSRILRVSRVETSTSRGSTCECAGTSSTSSNVKASGPNLSFMIRPPTEPLARNLKHYTIAYIGRQPPIGGLFGGGIDLPATETYGQTPA